MEQIYGLCPEKAMNLRQEGRRQGMCAISWTKSIPSSLLSVIKGEERDGGGGG